MQNIIYFHIDDPIIRLSDHSKISVRMIANFWPNEMKRCTLSFPEQFKWDKVSPQLLTESLRSEEIHSNLVTILETQINDMSDIDNVVVDFSNLLTSAAN